MKYSGLYVEYEFPPWYKRNIANIQSMSVRIHVTGVPRYTEVTSIGQTLLVDLKRTGIFVLFFKVLMFLYITL